MEIVMLAIAICLLCSGSALGCAVSERRFEDFLPLTLAVLVLAQLLPGLLGALNAGFWLAILLMVAAWAWTLIRVFRRRQGADFARRFFDGPFFLFLGMCFVLVLLNYGKLLASWDEFSHWGDVVRMMLSQQILSIDPASRSLFPEYPPAMALLQYFLARLCCPSGGKNAEWLFYFMYQFSLFALFFPLLREGSLRKGRTWLLLAGVFLLPAVFQANAYAKIYIDSFLGTLFGLLLYWLLYSERQDRLWLFQLCAMLLLLTLSKALGLAFALAALLVAYVQRKSRLWLPLLATMLPAATWWWNALLRQGSSGMSGGKLSAALAESGFRFATYHFDILKRYILALLTRPLSSSEALLPGLPAVVLMPLLLAGIWLLLGRERRREFWLLAAFHLLYLLGLGLTFPFFFPKEEATELLGLERYLNSLLLADGVLLFLAAERQSKGLRSTVLLLALLLLLTPLQSTARFLTRREVLYSQRFRAPYMAFEELLCPLVPENARLLLYTEGDTMGGMVLRSDLRPRLVELDLQSEAYELAQRFDFVAVYGADSGVSTLSRVNADGSLSLIAEETRTMGNPDENAG